MDHDDDDSTTLPLCIDNAFLLALGYLSAAHTAHVNHILLPQVLPSLVSSSKCSNWRDGFVLACLRRVKIGSPSVCVLSYLCQRDSMICYAKTRSKPHSIIIMIHHHHHHHHHLIIIMPIDDHHPAMHHIQLHL